MAGFLARSPFYGVFPARRGFPLLTASDNKNAKGIQNIQLRVQLRFSTGFPFTSRPQVVRPGYTIIGGKSTYKL